MSIEIAKIMTQFSNAPFLGAWFLASLLWVPVLGYAESAPSVVAVEFLAVVTMIGVVNMVVWGMSKRGMSKNQSRPVRFGGGWLIMFLAYLAVLALYCAGYSLAEIWVNSLQLSGAWNVAAHALIFAFHLAIVFSVAKSLLCNYKGESA